MYIVPKYIRRYIVHTHLLHPPYCIPLDTWGPIIYFVGGRFSVKHKRRFYYNLMSNFIEGIVPLKINDLRIVTNTSLIFRVRQYQTENCLQRIFRLGLLARQT